MNNLGKAIAVMDSMRAQGLMLATVESCTGGMIAAALTDIPGSSEVLERGFVTYSNAAKAEMVDVPPALIDRWGAVSPQVAEAMALGGLKRSSADIVVSVTGIAGPGGSEFKPEGLVCFHVASRGGGQIALTREFGPQGRAAIRSLSVTQAFDLILELLKRL
jgi:nicotinamide-nucleotide amidase